MRYYHIHRIELLAGVSYLLGMLLLLPWILIGPLTFDIYPDFLWPIALCLWMGAIPLGASARYYMKFRFGSEHPSPNSPEGIPVDPTGLRVDDDTLLPAGKVVLARRDGKWYRAVVLESRTRDRVLIHYLGWDSFYDEVHRRSELQIFPDESPVAAITPAVKGDTSISEQ